MGSGSLIPSRDHGPVSEISETRRDAPFINLNGGLPRPNVTVAPPFLPPILH